MKSNILLIFVFLLFSSSCQEKEHGPLVKSGKTPSKLSGIEVENINGGARITYSLPDDYDLLYVLAVFSSREGEERVVKSSLYKNYVVLDGFADTSEYVVNLYTVNRSEKRSEPVATTIHPLTPPIHTVFQSLKVSEDFGGVNVNFVNEPEKEYIFHTLYKDESGEWVNYDRLYTKSKTRDYSVRGLPSEPTEFAFYFTDRWKNHSDTLVKTLTPLYEEKLDKSIWKHLPLDNDTYIPQSYGWRFTNAFDGDFNSLFYQKLSGASMPNWFTLDLGRKNKFSRMVVHQAPTSRASYSYNYGTPRLYEIWGSNDPSWDGSWDNWTLLLECESIKPSGSAVGVTTAEDRAYAMAGENYNFPLTAGKYRYIRFKTLKSWTGAENLMLTELTLYGQPD